MKNLIRTITFAAAAGAFALVAAPSLRAQDAAASQNPCEAAYNEFLSSYQQIKKATDAKDTAGADAARRHTIDVGKNYLAKCPNDNADYVKYVQSWVTKNEAYEKQQRKQDVFQAINAKDYNKAFQLGQNVLAVEPDDLPTLIMLSYYAAYPAEVKGDTSHTVAGIEDAKKAISLIESGKTMEKWDPFKDKNDAIANLNFAIGEMLFKQNPTEAETYYIKAIKTPGTVKDTPGVYYRLGQIYINTQYTPMAADYKAKYEGKEETPQSKAALANLNGVADEIIDAFARAVALSGTKPEYQSLKTSAMETLTGFYKFRHDNKTDGMDQFIASVLQKPLPDPFVPAPIPPVTAPATTGTTSGAAATATPTKP